jgi:hypothetical protein
MPTVDQEIRRGDEAQRLMSAPLLQEAFEKVESGLIDAMKRVPMGDTKTQHELVLSLQLFGRIKGHLAEVMETGKLALIQKETMAAKAKRLFRAA